MINFTKQAIKRNEKGQYLQVIEGGWKTKQKFYQQKYLLSHPWAKHWQWSKSRAKHKGWEHTLTVEDFRKLWERDNAYYLKAPSIDRIDSKKGYIVNNCRFIERSLNISLGNRYTNRTEKQRRACAENLRNYKKLNPIPWNKKI